MIRYLVFFGFLCCFFPILAKALLTDNIYWDIAMFAGFILAVFLDHLFHEPEIEEK